MRRRQAVVRKPILGKAVCIDPSDGREVGHSTLDTTVKGAGKSWRWSILAVHAVGMPNLNLESRELKVHEQPQEDEQALITGCPTPAAVFVLPAPNTKEDDAWGR